MLNDQIPSITIGKLVVHFLTKHKYFCKEEILCYLLYMKLVSSDGLINGI